MFIKLIFIILFFAAMLWIGIRSGRGSEAADVDGFVLGGRKVGPWLTAFSFGTSYFSAVIFIGYAGRFGWNFGLASTWIGLGNALIGSLLAWMVLGRRTRIMTQHIGSKTMPDFFGNRFGSRGLTTAASLIVFVFLIPYTASLFNGLSQLFSMSFSGVSYTFWVVIMAALTGAYVVFGGYMGSAINNFIQGIIMLIGIIAVVAAVIAGNGGLTEAIAKLSEGSATTAMGTEFRGAYTSFFGPSPVQLLGVVILTSLGTWGLPQMVGKFYAIKDEDAIKKGTVISTFFAFVVAGGCYFLGGFGRLYAGDILYKADGTPSFDTIIPSMLDTVCGKLGVWGDILLGIVLVLVLAASMSTLSSLVLTSSSTITLDLIAPAAKGSFNEKKKMVFMRLFVVFFIVVSALIAIFQAKSPNTYISDLMGISWGALAGAFLAPFLYGLFWKRTTKSAVIVSFVCGIGIAVAEFVLTSVLGIQFENAFLHYFFNSSINAGMLAMLAGLVIVPVVSLLSPRPEAEKMQQIFSCYDAKVTVGVKDSLGK